MNNKIQDNINLISRYKSDIDLVSFLGSIGFTVDKERTTKKWPVMEDATSNRKLIIGKNASNGQFYYWNPNDSNDKGTIIELLAQHKQLDLSRKEGWNELHRECGNMIGNVYFTQHDHITAQPTRPQSRQEALTQYFKLDELKNTDFLNLDRRLTNETIYAPEFRNKIFNKSYIDKTYQTAGKNTVFPIENQGGVIGIINRNTVWNQIQGSKDNGVWASNVLPGVPVKEMVISEAPIDSLSYHQLNPPKQEGDRLYIATAGTLSAGQPLTIQSLINQANPERLILANDNDFQGIRYNINLMGSLILPNQPNTGITLRINNSAHSNTLIVEINNEIAAKNGVKTDIESIKDRIDQVMNRGFPPGAQKAKLNVITNRPDLTQLQVTFPNIRPLLIRAENITNELRQAGDKIIIKRAVENDWNQDLQIKATKDQVLSEVGIKLSPAQVNDLIKKDKTEILLDRNNDPGKLILDYTKGNVTPVFLPRLPAPIIPEQYLGVNLTPADKHQLLETGELQKRVDIKHPTSGENLSGYIGLDKDLNQLVFLRGDRLKNYNIYQTDVNESQLKDIISGQTVQANRHQRDPDGIKFKVPVEVRISATKGEIIIREPSVANPIRQEVKEKQGPPSNIRLTAKVLGKSDKQPVTKELKEGNMTGKNAGQKKTEPDKKLNNPSKTRVKLS